ncbi:hypothetical protein CDL15_Pgr025943 [Punica granatum]|uniref:Uncharacterized protein n=1 Tax=Punica granatum TaxID=22663 RepID=A0A218WC42_PUNGR|nr:hypothetical protein CDL15_Pgr025943 [Punica granatum]PKI35232.1 hypothetical protein CRG98_044398 [Punica granatum]
MKKKTMKSRKLHHMEFFGSPPPPSPPPPEFPFPFQFPPPPHTPPTVCRFYPCFPPMIVVEGAPPTVTAHHHYRSLWAVGGGIVAGVIAFSTIYNGLFSCKRNTGSMIKGIAGWIAKGEEGTSGRAAGKTESNADAAESQQSVSSTPESKEEES